MRGPRYARLNHEFDRDLLLAEIEKLPRDQFRRITATRFDKSILPYAFNPGEAFEIAPPEVLDQSTYSIWKGDEKSDVIGSVLWEGDHLGNVHRDSAPGFTRPWMEQGFGTININLRDGGSMLWLDLGDQLIGRSDPCFTFDESQYHGSDRGSERRIQISVTGKFSSQLEALVDPGSLFK